MKNERHIGKTFAIGVGAVCVMAERQAKAKVRKNVPLNVGGEEAR